MEVTPVEDKGVRKPTPEAVLRSSKEHREAR